MMASADVDRVGDKSIRLFMKILVQAAQYDDALTLQRFHQLIHVQTRAKFKQRVLLQILRAYPDNFAVIEDGGGLFVKPVTNLGLCPIHCSKNKTCFGPNCGGLHICKFYLLSDKCRFRGSDCNYGHDLSTSHNHQKLREHFLDELTVEEQKFLLRQGSNRNVTTVPKICKFYNVKDGCRYSTSGSSCPSMHICKHYISGNCSFGPKCRRNHNIFDRDVIDVLEKHGIDVKRTPKEILAVLRDAVVDDGVESASQEGNTHRGFVKTGQAKKWASQPALGLGGRALSLVTAQDDSDSDSSLCSEVSQSSTHRRRRRNRRNRNVSESSNPLPPLQNQVSTEIGQKICLYNLRGRCAFGGSCRNVHRDLPYQWQVLKQQGDWDDFEPLDNRELELAFSEANGDECFVELGNQGTVCIDFTTMKQRGKFGRTTDVRRLTTVSSGEVESQPLATRWIWFWQDQNGKWVRYGGKNVTGYKASITSDEIEQKYLANPDGQMKFSTMGHEYILDFDKMFQRNIQYKTVRQVRRRPEFVSRDEVKKRKAQSNSKSVTSDTGSAEGAVGGVPSHDSVPWPNHWRVTQNEDMQDHCSKIEISKKFPSTRSEYKKIEKLFYDSMPNTAVIQSVERVQNGELWINYVNKRNRMTKKNNNQPVDERHLFHGTQSSYVDAICKQGFDFRLSGQTSGSVYGKGSYFARDAKYSDCYTDRKNKLMFVVRVLVGDYVVGNKSYARPPSKNPSNPCSDLYDTCVDSKTDPKIFVVFDFYQVYPEYVITYDMKFD